MKHKAILKIIVYIGMTLMLLFLMTYDSSTIYLYEYIERQYRQTIQILIMHIV